MVEKTVECMVEWMRAHGVARLRDGDLEVWLDPLWRPPVEEPEPVEQADEGEEKRKVAARRPFRHVR